MQLSASSVIIIDKEYTDSPLRCREKVSLGWFE